MMGPGSAQSARPFGSRLGCSPLGTASLLIGLLVALWVIETILLWFLPDSPPSLSTARICLAFDVEYSDFAEFRLFLGTILGMCVGVAGKWQKGSDRLVSDLGILLNAFLFYVSLCIVPVLRWL